MKYLVVAALLALLLILVYSRIRPYLAFLRKIVGSLNAVADSSSSTTSAKPSAVSVKSKLVRCDRCGTWVPVDRTIGPRVGGSTYCSRACLEKPLDRKEEKIAG